MDGTVSFDRDWAMYLKGFGNLTGEHWLGRFFSNETTTTSTHYAVTNLRYKVETIKGGQLMW